MYVYVKGEREREEEGERKKGKIFVLLKELACMYRCGRKKSACVWSRSDNDNVTKLGIEKKKKKKQKKEPCTCGHWDRMYDVMVSPRFRTYTMSFHQSITCAYVYIYIHIICIGRYSRKINKHPNTDEKV